MRLEWAGCPIAEVVAYYTKVFVHHGSPEATRMAVIKVENYDDPFYVRVSALYVKTSNTVQLP
jgi:hypothetical protein